MSVSEYENSPTLSVSEILEELSQDLSEFLTKLKTDGCPEEMIHNVSNIEGFIKDWFLDYSSVVQLLPCEVVLED